MSSLWQRVVQRRSEGWVDWMKISVIGKVLKGNIDDCSEDCYDVWFRDLEWPQAQ